LGRIEGRGVKAPSRAVAGVIAANLALFIVVVSLPSFEASHHHWIFPALAGLFAFQWLLTLPRIGEGLWDRRAARAALVSLIAFLLIMGIVRHATILACFDRCSFKLAAAAAAGGLVFFAHRFTADPGFWSAVRCGVAALGALLWAVFLALKGAQVAPWLMDSGFIALGLLLWLGRSRPEPLLAALGVAAGLVIRVLRSEHAVIVLGVLAGVALPLWAAPRVEAWLEERAKRAQPPAEPRRGLLWSALRVGLAVGVIAGLGVYAAGPIFYVSEPEKRQAVLRAAAPSFPVRDPKTLSPLAARLRAHVVHLAQTVGPREASDKKARDRARDYVTAQLKAAGYAPKTLPYGSQWLAGLKNGTEFHNVEAILRVAPVDGGPAWIVGAHYDTNSGTPGADDNSSGTAVLLEVARLLKQRAPGREIRFVAFGTEEPPAFGTRNMGSYRYARALKDDGVKVHGMISLEMLGYFNDKPGSQLYPPFFHLFYPDRGDFVGAVADGRSRALLREFVAGWRRVASFPLTSTVLPGPLSGLALSDQLNFWELGYPAVMLSDTAFYRNPNYHEASDLPDTLDYERMAEVTRAVAGVLVGEGAQGKTAAR
jgi:hypothetical protein